MGLSLKFGKKDKKKNNGTRKNDSKESGKEPKRYTVSFSLAGVISLCVLTLVALSWIFILGVLVGRGYKPEKAVPELERIMPQPQEQAQPEPPKVLKPEELEFYSDLSGKQPEKEQAPEKKQAVRTAPKKAPAPAPKRLEEPRRPEKVKVTVKVRERTPGVQSYRFTYQVASLKNHEAAQRVQKKLSGLGLSSSIQTAKTSKGTWHRVLVTMNGTDQDAAALRKKLGSVGISKPFLKSRKAL